jgi:cation:H+ antiporter
MNNAADFDQDQQIKVFKTQKSVGFIILGLAMLVGGGTLVVDNAILIAKTYGLSDKLIGLTILAAGTSLPELATSAVAAYKRNTDIAIGNVVGSNIFNLLFILPITGMINPMEFNLALNFDISVLVVATVVLMIFMFTLKYTQTRSMGSSSITLRILCLYHLFDQPRIIIPFNCFCFYL